MEYQPRMKETLIIENAPGRADSILNLYKESGAPFVLWESTEEETPGRALWKGIVSSGGPQHVVEGLDARLQHVQEYLLDQTSHQTPILAICLSHQLLSAGLGARLSSYHSPIVGIEEILLTKEGKEDPLFKGLTESFQAFQYHSDYVTNLPDGTRPLCASQSCALEAFRVDDAPVWSVQFHPEINPEAGYEILSSRGLNAAAVAVEKMCWHGYKIMKNFMDYTR